MAPEILLEKPYTRAVDWWAFGVLLYEMISGQAPFKGDDEEDIFEAILEDDVRYPPTMSREGVDLLKRLLCKDPTRRLGSGRADAEEIKRHPYFRSVDWDAHLELRIPPPFAPQVVSVSSSFAD
jgi:serine/threonine protein kinase